jgi:hypothetical protein
LRFSQHCVFWLWPSGMRTHAVLLCIRTFCMNMVPRNLNSISGIVKRLQTGGSGIWVPAGTNDFSLPLIIKPKSEVHLASYSIITAGSSARRETRHGVKLTAHQCLVFRLRKCGAITLLSLHTFMTKTETVLPFLALCGAPSSGSKCVGYKYGRLH